MIDNSKLLLATIKAKELNIITDELASLWIEIVKRRLHHPSFHSFTWNRDDLQAEALKALCLSGLKFDQTKSDNPFAYFIDIINGAFISYISREKIQNSVKDVL